MKRNSNSGFTLIESLIVVAIGITLAAIAVPMTINAMKAFKLTAGVASVTGAIQSTRFKAIMHSYQYQLVINNTALTYQVYYYPPGNSSFTPEPPGLAVPILRLGDATINQSVTLTFKANGTVVVAAGTLPFTITNGITTESINVSGVGNVTVTP